MGWKLPARPLGTLMRTTPCSASTVVRLVYRLAFPRVVAQVLADLSAHQPLDLALLQRQEQIARPYMGRWPLYQSCSTNSAGTSDSGPS